MQKACAPTHVCASLESFSPLGGWYCVYAILRTSLLYICCIAFRAYHKEESIINRERKEQLCTTYPCTTEMICAAVNYDCMTQRARVQACAGRVAPPNTHSCTACCMQNTLPRHRTYCTMFPVLTNRRFGPRPLFLIGLGPAGAGPRVIVSH